MTSSSRHWNQNQYLHFDFVDLWIKKNEIFGIALTGETHFCLSQQLGNYKIQVWYSLDLILQPKNVTTLLCAKTAHSARMKQHLRSLALISRARSLLAFTTGVTRSAYWSLAQCARHSFPIFAAFKKCWKVETTKFVKLIRSGNFVTYNLGHKYL